MTHVDTNSMSVKTQKIIPRSNVHNSRITLYTRIWKQTVKKQLQNIACLLIDLLLWSENCGKQASPLISLFHRAF